jgi:hypothetical protein
LKAASREDDPNVVFDTDADALVKKLVEIVDSNNGIDKEVYEAAEVCEFCDTLQDK